MNKLKHYILGYSLVLILNAAMLAFVCPQAKATLKVQKSEAVETSSTVTAK